MQTIIRRRHIWSEPWNEPRVSMNVPHGEQRTIIDRYASGGIGFLTDLGVLWVPRGNNGDLFYYSWYMDGDLREKIMRVTGGGSSTSSITGVPSPERYSPPLTFNRRLQIICVNNDSSDHVGEVIAIGYTIYRRPD